MTGERRRQRKKVKQKSADTVPIIVDTSQHFKKFHILEGHKGGALFLHTQNLREIKLGRDADSFKIRLARIDQDPVDVEDDCLDVVITRSVSDEVISLVEIASLCSQ
jgi:hypothetical protein